MSHTQRHRKNAELVDKTKLYTLDEGLKILRKRHRRSSTRPSRSPMKLGVDVKKSEQMVRGAISLPRGIGKELRVICLRQGREGPGGEGRRRDGGRRGRARQARGGGWTDFDVAVATPDMMKVVGRLGKGARAPGQDALPKSGTVTNDVATAVREFKAGKVEFRVDAAGNVHAPSASARSTKRDPRRT
jgi:large subunit ribosomal protein L1